MATGLTPGPDERPGFGLAGLLIREREREKKRDSSSARTDTKAAEEGKNKMTAERKKEGGRNLRPSCCGCRFNKVWTDLRFCNRGWI